MDLADKYLELRRQGELLVGSALDQASMSSEDERKLLLHEFVLVTSDAERAIGGNKSAEERIESAMNGFLRHLTNRSASRGARMDANANGEARAVLSLFEKIRTARRGMIEALREEISTSGDIEAARECCRLLEEEIGAARASKDLEGERIAAASLEVVRRLAVSEAGAEDEEDGVAVVFAQTLVANGDIASEDEEWTAARIRRYLEVSTAPDSQGEALHKTLVDYRERNRQNSVA